MDSVHDTALPLDPLPPPPRGAGQPLAVTRTGPRLLPDSRRVLARPFVPGEWAAVHGTTRLETILERIAQISDAEAAGLLAEVRAGFGSRHADLDALLEDHCATVAPHLADDGLAPERRRLVGAYLTREYALEAAALSNPSIVLAPDQEGVVDGAVRFIVSLRAVGEGHLSSIELRSGTLGAAGHIALDEPGPWASTGIRSSPEGYDKHLFRVKLAELGADDGVVARVVDHLPDPFGRDELEAAITAVYDGLSASAAHESVKLIHLLAASNYVVTFTDGTPLSERVLYPAAPRESQGMEDARLVRFTGEDGAVTYYATYTAYDGFSILPQLIETPDFRAFRIATLNGAAAQNKGMALFPRKVGGSYMALGRQDRESITIMTSDNVRFWTTSDQLHPPSQPWELVQTGNCGSPMETEAGWLVLTHGVGPMRRYTLGAILLDLDDPSRVIARLPDPILGPDESERDGYVPNVVYSCGGIVHDGCLVLPYGFSDVGAAFALIGMDDLLDRLADHRSRALA
jgi:predicted GH43/DUF377 family glycosyl hydrolase